MERAKEMLRAPAARVLDVAVACGFKTQQHFARVFRHVYGASPTEYRHEWRSRDPLEHHSPTHHEDQWVGWPGTGGVKYPHSQ